MRRSTVVLCAATLAALYLAPVPLGAQEEGTLSKRKEGTYFLEIGEVFLKSDEFGIEPAIFDPDGAGGPLAPHDVGMPTDDVFSTDPRVTMGLNRPDGKWSLAFTAWEFNAEDGLVWDTDPASSSLTSNLAIPFLIFTRPGGVNPLQEVLVASERDLKYFAASWERNLHQTKRHRTRLLVGLKYVQFEDRLQALHLYGSEFFETGTGFREFNDRQAVRSTVTSERLGPSIGIESRWSLGKRFRLTSRAELQMGQESIVVQYGNIAAEFEPEIEIGDFGFRFRRTRSIPPFGVNDRELVGSLDLFMDEFSESRIVPTGEISVRGAWDLGRGVTAGLEYRFLGIYDVPSSLKTAETVRDTISDIDVDVEGLGSTDPDLVRVIWNYEVGDIVQRHDVVFQGLNAFLRFHF